MYLGRPADLTAERLQEAAELLADGWSEESGLSGAWRRGQRAHSCSADFGRTPSCAGNETSHAVILSSGVCGGDVPVGGEGDGFVVGVAVLEAVVEHTEEPVE